MYTLSKRARNNDVIQIDNQNMEISKPYIIDSSSPILEKIILTGINGRPTIRGENSTGDNYLLDDKVTETQENLAHISVHVENICFTNIGIVRVKKASSNLIIRICNSTVSELMGSNTTSIIDSSALRTMVLVKNSLLRNIMRGVCLENSHNEFKIVDSKVVYDEHKLFSQQCPKLIVTGDFVSLSAPFIRSKFKRIFLIDLKSTEQTTSNISIIDSAFDDEGISDCSSHMRIRDGALLIANLSFTKVISTKQLVHVSSSYVVLRKCIFKDIRSLLSPLAISSKGVASIFDCRFENNSGLNGAAIHASLNSVLNISQCVFKRNRAKSQGGALMFNQTLTINISGCFFIDNQAEDKGGAIYYRGKTMFLNTTVFTNNTAKGGGVDISGSLSSVLNVIHCVFKRNKVEKYNPFGGAISVLSGIKVTVSNTEFTNNAAVDGAAIYAKFVPVLNLVQCVFKSKRGTGFGGALCNYNTSTINILRCLFTENHAKSFGGAIFFIF